MSVRSLGKSVKILCTLTPMMSLTSFLCFIVALIAPYWIYVEEKFPNKNRTILFGPNASIEYLERFSYGGLWKVCSRSYFEEELICHDIEYFSTNSYEPDPYDSSLVIPYSILNSAGYFFAAGTFMFGGSLLFFCGHFLKKKKILIFVSGIMFILSGLLLFVGQIVFIAVFKAEVGGKLVPKSALSPPLLSYKYGISFTLIVLSFLLSELSGTSAIFYFIYHYQYKWSITEIPSSSASNKLATKKKGMMIGANKTNGFIPNRRHSFDNISELGQSNGGSNWKFSRSPETPLSTTTTTPLPTSLLNFEGEDCPRHYALACRSSCFCHEGRNCPNNNGFINYSSKSFPHHWGLTNGGHYYWPPGRSHMNYFGSDPWNQRDIRMPFSPPVESEEEEPPFSPSSVMKFEVSVSQSPVPAKGILKQSKSMTKN